MNSNAKMLGAEKMLGHFDRLAVWQSGGLPAPVTVELNLTNICNHACPGCTFSFLVNVDGPKDSLPYGLAERIITDLARMGVRAVTFSGGGEPLVYGESRVFALAALAFGHGMDVALITNGSLLKMRDWHDILTWVRVSLDSYDEETFARYHGRSGGEFNKIVKRLQDFCAMPRGLATRGVGFLTDADSLNRGDFARMSQFCATFAGLDYVQFRPLVKNMVDDPSLHGGGKHLDSTKAQSAWQEAAELYSREDFKVLYSEGKYAALNQPNYGRQYDRCLAHFLEATIAADGKVYICCHTQGQERFSLGSLHDQNFADIWNGDKARFVYESFDPRISCPPACRLHLQNSTLLELGGITHKNFI